MHKGSSVYFHECLLNQNSTHPLTVPPRKQMSHCTEEEHCVQLISKDKNATVMQDMKAANPAWVEIISRGASGLQQ